MEKRKNSSNESKKGPIPTDPYQVLKIKKDATIDEIKQAIKEKYFECSLIENEEEREKWLKAVKNAYTILKDKKSPIIPEIIQPSKTENTKNASSTKSDLTIDLKDGLDYEIKEETKYAEEEVKNFIAEFNLYSILPLEFNELNGEQKLRVVQDLKHRIVDIVKSDAQTQYSEKIKTAGLKGKLMSSIIKETDIYNSENDIFKKLKESDEGRELIRQDLEILTKKAQKRDIYISTTGKACVNYLNAETIEELNIFSIFNEKANAFASIPYEWSQEKKGISIKVGKRIIGNNHKKEYEKAKTEYEKARNEILKIKTEKEGPEDKGKAMLEILETENVIKMEQLLNTHPEVEKILDNVAKDPSTIKEIGKISGSLINTLTGKNNINRALMAGGFGARMLAKGATILTGVSVITYLGGVAVGGVVGGLRGRIRGKETLQERQKQARHGQKDTTKEKTKMVDVAPLISGLEKMANRVEEAVGEEKTKKLAKLAVLIEYSQDQIEKGQVNFGDAKTILNNQFNFVNNLNRALVLKESNSKETNTELQERINGLIRIQASKVAEKTSEAQEKFLKKQMLVGAGIGAGFATAGYALRYVGEQFGWWGGHSTENINSKNNTEIPTKQPISSTNPHHVPFQKQTGPIITETTSESSATDIPKNPPGINNFINKEIKFEKGKGGIEGVWELLKQKNPKTTYAQAVKEAMKLGLYDPNNPNESALIREGSTLKFDDKGNIIFHDVKTGKDVTHYTEKMFDSDKPKIETTTTIPKEISKPTQPIQEITSKTTPEEIKELTEQIKKTIDTDEPIETVHHIGTQQHEIGHKAYIGNKADIGTNGMQTGRGGIITVDQKHFLTSLSWKDRLIYEDNPYYLSGGKLIEVYKISKENLNYLVDNKISVSDYKNMLKEYVGFEPKKGFWGIGDESDEHYIARALQALVAEKGKDGVKLETFQKHLRGQK